MCRIAAYLGRPCRLGGFLVEPEHGLARQSWDAREMESATVNADGWGLGWYDDRGRPAVYRQTLPIWADDNVDALGRSLVSPLWMANVRSATPGLGIGHANTQPFADETLLFLHNGFIDRFAHTLRATIRAELDAGVEASINGNTDSEYLFALLRQQQGDLITRLQAMLERLHELLADAADIRALLNFIITDGQRLVAVRSAVRANPPSLYVNRDWRAGIVIASEPLDRHPGWQPVAADEILNLAPTPSPQSAVS